MRTSTTLLLLAVCAFGCDDARYGSATHTGDTELDVSDASDLEDVAPDVRTDTDLLPDTSPPDVAMDVTEPPGGVCELKFESDAGAGSCQLDVRGMTACDDLARCICEIAGAELESCLAGLIVPRGAITLADYCKLSGHTPTLSIEELAEQFESEWFVFGGPGIVETSAECSELAAFSLWGEEASWNLSWQPNTRDVPPAPWTLSEIELDPLPLATLDDVVSYERATAELILDGGRLADVAPNAAPRPALFVVHTDHTALMVGLFWTIILSSLPPDDAPVILYEQLTEDEYGIVRFSEYPQPGPARPPAYQAELHDAALASQGKLLDAGCISSCGCPAGRACRDGVCQAVRACSSDADCCLSSCRDGACR